MRFGVKRMVDFLDNRCPKVVGVGGFNVITRRLLGQIKNVVGDLTSCRQGSFAGLLDRALIKDINSVGIDINMVVPSPYKAHLLKFAQALIKNAESDDQNGACLGNLIRKLLTWNIFMNCRSFLRVHTNVNGDVLDNTRIHQGDDNLARKIAADTLEVDIEGLKEDDGSENVNGLRMEDYTHRVEMIQLKPKRMTLEAIKERQIRRSRRVSSSPALKTKIRDRTATCRLDSGLESVIAIQNVADQKIGTITDALIEGQTL
ncbi:Transcription elongation factor spt6 [Podila clonocystis]|nr:Transcription elongation factor spt6 [Podila clonocystis]